MDKYKKLNNIFGLVMFIFAAVVYTLTMESSGSFWDCGEFVSGCWKLQVVHPPGAPFFLILGRLFTFLAFGDVTKVAMMVNFMSGLATAGAVLFTFWTVTALARKIIFKDGNYTDGRIYTVIAAGVIAAGCGTFLDSLWFSAVEGEVYALSQFFMSLIFWAIMKWDADDSKYADHWLVFIAYMTGLSIGVHLLSLLAIPAIALVYYYKKYKPSIAGWFGAIAVGFVVLGVYMKFIISYTQTFLSSFDKLFVNSFNMPFNSGVIFFLFMLVAIIAGGIWFSQKTNRPQLNTIFLCLAFSYIGYLSYLMVPIRSAANPPINMNRPTDPFSLKSYVDREQYGDRPLVKGPDYTATSYDIEKMVVTGERWYKDAKSGKYAFGGNKQDYQFRDDAQMLFPRLGFWQEEAKKQGFRAWLNPEYNVVERPNNNVVRTFSPSQYKQATEYASSLSKDEPGRYYVKDNVGMAENLRFFFSYQIGYMYFRYFMWNFSGRQDDIQGTYANDNGRWISGIPFIDNSGAFYTPEWPQENLSKSMLQNKARNKFFMIPFIIGLIGLIYTFLKDEKTFWIILVLFGTTGLLQIVYQNEPPIEPRERDYAQAGSFLTYCMWIGFGVIWIAEFLRKKIGELPGVAVAFAVTALAPFLMGSQGWDDHTRHHRYTSRDFAVCYLESCAPNAVIFTQGDNDTYPLWYAQEVENVRPDIRIINLSLLGVDWYIDQLRYKMNDAPPLKFSFTPEQYQGSKRDVVRYTQGSGIPDGTPIDLKRVMQFIASDDPSKKVAYRGEESENYLPTRTFYLDVDTANQFVKNAVSDDEQNKIVPRMVWSINNGMLLKNDLMTLDIIANNVFERPIYFAVSVAPDAYMGLEKYFQLEGLAYRVVPKENPSGSPYNAPVRSDVMYDNMLKKFKFGGIAENPNIYLDENILRMTVNIRGNFGRLADALLEKGEKEKAAEAIDYSLKVLPPNQVPHSVFNYSYPEVYYKTGQKEKGRKLLLEMFDKCKDELNYYKTVYQYLLRKARDNGDMAYVQQLQQGGFMERRELREQLYIMQELSLTSKRFEDAEFSAKIDKEFTDSRMAFVVQLPGQ
jgi:hypothetical protein